MPSSSSAQQMLAEKPRKRILWHLSCQLKRHVPGQLAITNRSSFLTFGVCPPSLSSFCDLFLFSTKISGGGGGGGGGVHPPGSFPISATESCYANSDFPEDNLKFATQLKEGNGQEGS